MINITEQVKFSVYHRSIIYEMCLLFVLLLYLFVISVSTKFEHCIDRFGLGYIERRRLYIATCETGTHSTGWMKNDTLIAWNMTGSILLKQGVSMVNVCAGKLWEHKLLTKPLAYLDYARQLYSSMNDRERSLSYVIFTDSDTYWSVVDVSEVWNRFDCARKGKDMIVSTETACWIGYYCTTQDIAHWYSNLNKSPTFSPFANSGVYMGKLSLVYDMLSYIVANNESYFTLDTFHKVMKFHDQHAVTDYAIKVNPSRIQLDYHQQFAATFAFRVSVGKSANKHATAVCKTINGTVDYHCSDITARLSDKHRFYRVNESSCRTYRHFSDRLPHSAELEGIAPYPLIWHGNGAAKKIFLSYSLLSYKCYKKKLRLVSNMVQ